MLYDLTNLDPEQFENLCGALLSAEGNSMLSIARRGVAADHGVDFLFDTPKGERWVGDSILFRQRTAGFSKLQSAVIDLQNAVSLMKADKALLISSAPIDDPVRNQIRSNGIVELWGESQIQTLLDKHSEVREAFIATLESQKSFERLIGTRTAPEKTRGNQLLTELKAVPKGTEGWRDYESACVNILNYVFVPPLRTPRIQSRTHDGLDRRDAIYPIGSGDDFWDAIKYQHASRMVVVEFKNNTKEIAQEEVESLQQYLLPQAKRSFGLLCSRLGPSDSAIRARRRAWMISQGLILFLSDVDLEELVRSKDADEDPSAVLEAQMDNFFISLAP